MKTIKSISYNQQEIINDIMLLHMNGEPFEIDTTFSKGIFYKNGIVPMPGRKFDVYPLNGVEQFVLPLPFENNSVRSIMFDPPFGIAKGKSIATKKAGQNIIINRFSSFESPKDLMHCYCTHLKEYYRILKKGGILVFKCQATVSSGNNLFIPEFLMMKAFKIGFYPLDCFHLLAKNRLISGKIKKQRHARKYSSVFWVFKKIKPKFDYNLYL